jgi:N-acyl-D-aspartate/D-glutamate deacylase
LNYSNGDFEPIREMLTHPTAVLGLSDGGAHCGLICDASMPSFLLTHWARDRRRGARLPLEQVVHAQTQRTAQLFDFRDRGALLPGMKADLNVIDFEGLRIHPPQVVFDLPASGRRLIQRVDGYRATVCAGALTFEDGKATGALPGRLVRGPQAAPTR